MKNPQLMKPMERKLLCLFCAGVHFGTTHPDATGATRRTLNKNIDKYNAAFSAAFDEAMNDEGLRILPAAMKGKR